MKYVRSKCANYFINHVIRIEKNEQDKKLEAVKELEAEKQEQRDMAQDMQLMKEKEMQDVCDL